MNLRSQHTFGTSRFEPILLAVMLVVSLFGLLIVASSADASDDGEWTDRGLGHYGPTGAITAELVGNPEISPKTLELANSDELADVRAEWHDPQDFVSQVGYQLSFRQSYDHLDSSAERIGTVLRNREQSSKIALHELGLYLTNEEWEEFDRRVEAMERSKDVRAVIVGAERAQVIANEQPRAEFGPDYGGRWQDQLDGGKVKMGIVEGSQLDVDQLAELMPRPTDIEFIDVRYSWDELRWFAHLASEAAKKQGVEFLVAPHAPANQVLMTVGDAEYAVPAEIPANAIQVLHDPEALKIEDSHTNFNSDHSVLQQSPGLRIFLENTAMGFNDGYCTWGATGHTASHNYIVTAGHCVQDGSTTVVGYKNMSVWQYGTNGTKISDNTPYVVAKNHDLSDSARIESDTYGDTNCLHTETSSCGFTMTSRRSLYDHSVGDPMCGVYAKSNDYLCSNVTVLAGTWFDDFRVGYTRVDGKPDNGDSGSGIKLGNTWDGIYYAGNSTTSYFYPAYSVKTDLGFDFNCIRGGSSASGWLSCPIY